MCYEIDRRDGVVEQVSVEMQPPESRDSKVREIQTTGGASHLTHITLLRARLAAHWVLAEGQLICQWEIESEDSAEKAPPCEDAFQTISAQPNR
jgi:hypothetical protein